MKNKNMAAIACALTGAASLSLAQAPPNTESLWAMNIEQLLKVQITSASRFSESMLTSPSSVSVIERKDWEQQGARRTSDAFQNLSGVMVHPSPTGGNSIQVRGYGNGSVKGKAALLDDIPINSFVFGADVFSLDNLELDTLQKIEVVRGPSSVLYGSDAFHSAVSYQSWQPDDTAPQSKVSTGTKDYYHSSFQTTEKLGESWLLGLAIAASKQGDQQSKFEFESPDDGSIDHTDVFCFARF